MEGTAKALLGDAGRADVQRVLRGGKMEYSDYSYSAATQAEFYKAESALLRFGDRLVRSPCVKYMRGTFLAIDAVFATRMSHDVVLPVVPLITAFDLTDWKYRGDTARAVRARLPEFQFSANQLEIATQALRYMQALEWVAETVGPDFVVGIDTVLNLHEMLLNGRRADERYHGFRSTFLPHKKGVDPYLIPAEVNELCGFMNAELFSPLGQASAIHFAFEKIVPFDSMIDRTGLVLAFASMYKRGVFPHGYMVPICWGASVGLEYRKQLKDSSHDLTSLPAHEYFRERWAVYNAQNTLMSVVIADTFLATVSKLREKWRTRGLQIPANSAMDRLMDLFLAVPGLSTIRAAEVIGKSYGATNEAMRQLARAGIIREVALDGRERIFICEQSAKMITGFVEELVERGRRAESSGVRSKETAWDAGASSSDE